MQNIKVVFTAAAATMLAAMPASYSVEPAKTSKVPTKAPTKAPIKATVRRAPYVPQWAWQAVYSNALRSVPREFLEPAGFVPPKGVVRAAGSGDYLADMESGPDRWAPGRGPLQVFISQNVGMRPNFPSLFAAAMTEWCNASGGRLSWTQVNDPGSADITVDWQQNTPAGVVESGDTHTQYGVYNGHRVITRAQIMLITTNNSVPYSDEEMHKICLHEIGHALGLKHTSTSGDIMFWQSNPAQLSALGPRDANTISRLYNN